MKALSRGRNAAAIYLDLVSDDGFGRSYRSAIHYVQKLRRRQPVEARVVIQTEPGVEGQVDYGDGPMVRDPKTAKYRRTPLFILTLRFIRKAGLTLSTDRYPLFRKLTQYHKLIDRETHILLE